MRRLIPALAAALLLLMCGSPASAEDAALAEATTLNQQAQSLYQAGNYAEAEPLFQRALALREKLLGPDDPNVATSLNNLAALYQVQGRYAEAETLLKRSLAIDETALGPDDPGVATDLNNLAVLYWTEGRYAEAEPAYTRALAITEKALGADHPDMAQPLNNLGLLYLAQGRYADAEPPFKRALSIWEKALGANDPAVAQALNNLAELYRLQGRYAEAEPLFKRALAIREQTLGPDHPDLAASLNNLGALYWAEGRYAEAETPYRRALAIYEKALGPDHPDLAQSLNNLAELYKDQARYADAEPLFKRALAIKENAFGPDHPDVALSLNNLAEMYRMEHRYTEAEPLLDRALAIKEKALGKDHPDVARTLNSRAALNEEQGHYAKAEPDYRRALAIRERTLGPEHPDVAQSLNNLAVLYRAEKQEAEAEAASKQAVAIIARHLTVGDARSLGDSDAERRTNRVYFINYISIANAASGDDAESRAATAAATFRAAQEAHASSAAQAVAGMTARFAAGTDALAALVRERQDLARRRQLLDDEVVKAASKPAAERNAKAEAAQSTELAKAGATLDALDGNIAREFPQYAELSHPKPLQLQEAQALLAPDEAMLVYFVGDDTECWLWALRRDRAGFYRLDIGEKALTAEVMALRTKLDPDLNPDLTPFDAKRAYALYQKVVEPAAPLLVGASGVFVVPDGALQSLPLGVLVTRQPATNPETTADHRSVAWFAGDHALTVLPSVGALEALRKFASAGHATRPFVGIGDPVLDGKRENSPGVKLASLFRGAMADAQAVRELPRLPETADELRAVARDMGAGDDDLYLGERASEPLLRAAGLDRYRVIEFATHGLMSGDLEGLAEPALVLTPPPEASAENDGLLTASKVATFKLDADWVVLSACNTAATDGTPDAAGLSGLAKAFFYAGARSLLVSNWSVPSKATVKLVTGAFDELKKHPEIGRAEGLRRAEMAMLDPANPPEFAHPMMWAPFVLAGEGGAGR
jgi:tetratricopeptide (TPR) repeat protein